MAPTPSRVPRRSERFYDRASLAVLAVMLLIAALTFRDYGVTWDEAYHLTYGFHITRFWGSGFQDHTAVTYRIDYLYGGGFDATATAFRSMVRAFVERFDAVHLYGSFVGIVGVAGTWKLGRVLGGPRVGFITVLMMATTSVYYGHMFNNPKDLPFAAGYAWGLYFLFEMVGHFPRLPRWLIVKAGIAFGLAMSVRVGGLLLVCYLVLVLGLWLFHQAWIRRSAEHSYRVARRLVPRCLGVVGIAWVVMLLWWPWAWFDPVKRPLAALTRMAEFIDHRRWMPFAGEQVYNLDPPTDYLIHYFALKMPEYVVLGFVFCTVFGIVVAFTEGYWKLPIARRLVLGVLALSIWFPPVYAVYKGSPLYDGLRHFLFIIPPMIAAVAMAIDAGMTEAEQRFGHRGRSAVWVVFALLVGDQAFTMMRMHPHQYVYFNRFIGGLKGAVGNYSTDYYAQTFKESAENLAAEAYRTERETYLRSIYRVGGCIGRMRAMRYLPSNFKWKEGTKAYDFSINYTRGDCSESYPEAPVIAKVEREGGLLNLSRDHRKIIVDAAEYRRLKAASKSPQDRKNKRKKSRPKNNRPVRPNAKRPTGTLPQPQ